MSDLSSSLDGARHWTVRHRKGQLIYDEGEPSEAMYRVAEGCVRLQVNGPKGDRQIVAFLFPGDMFGLDLDRRNASAEAVTDVVLTRYSLQSVMELSSRSSQVTVELIASANALYGDLVHHVQQITHLSSVERVLWFLHWLAKREEPRTTSGPVTLPMSRRDIGDYLGLTPETLSRAIRQLKDEGQITTRGLRAITLKRPVFTLRAA